MPKDFTAAEEQAFEEERSRRASRRGSSFFADDELASIRRQSFAQTSPPLRRQSSPLAVASVVPGPQTAPPQFGIMMDPSAEATPIRRPSQSPPRTAVPLPRRSGSLSSAAAQNVQTSPATLSFQLPRTSTLERVRSPMTSERPRGGSTVSSASGVGPSSGPSGTAPLTPVKEALTRTSTRQAEDI